MYAGLQPTTCDRIVSTGEAVQAARGLIFFGGVLAYHFSLVPHGSSTQGRPHKRSSVTRYSEHGTELALACRVTVRVRVSTPPHAAVHVPQAPHAES